MGRVAAGRFAVLACALLLVGACGGGGGGAARSAAQRFDDAVAVVAKALGRSEDEVQAGFRQSLPTATMDDLAVQAERSAARAAELERIAAQAARDARRQAMVDTVYGATCDYIEVYGEVQAAPPEERWQRFEEILVAKLAEHQFDTGADDVQALSEDVADLWNAMTADSTRSITDIAADLACFAA